MSDRQQSGPKKIRSLAGKSRAKKKQAPPSDEFASSAPKVSLDAGWHPPIINTLEDTGLTKLNIAELILKIVYNGGDMTGHMVAKIIKLPFGGVLDGVVDFLKHEQLIDYRGSTGLGDASYRYVLTAKGSERAHEALSRSQYAGAAPVPLDKYIEALNDQAAHRPPVHQEQLRGLMTNLVVTDEMLNKVGPAVNSGQAIFLYGPPGNGKTTIAERVGRMILGEDMWIPYAVDVVGQVIQLYDLVNHEVSDDPPQYDLDTGVILDPRWICIKRPMIMVGGELTLESLDLVYDEINKFYEAPFQMKANGGLFLIDDFGRQQVAPADLLNRWIVPLETRIDFLALNNGRKIAVPFHVLTIFSTNLDPKELVDEAFLRRIRHKIEVGNPELKEFRAIFKIMCRITGIPYDEEGLRYLVEEWFYRFDRDMRMVHPRDILAQLVDIAGYLDIEPTMSDQGLLDQAAASYFVEL
jgi:DNA polymerase III delta prime subunit